MQEISFSNAGNIIMKIFKVHIQQRIYWQNEKLLGPHPFLTVLFSAVVTKPFLQWAR